MELSATQHGPGQVSLDHHSSRHTGDQQADALAQARGGQPQLVLGQHDYNVVAVHGGCS